jgi:FixJ family two-component response regulator
MRANRGTVYVVDDDPSVRRGLTDLLQAAGWTVESFAAAREFLDSVTCDGMGCIVLDVSMPDMTGPELHDELRACGRTLPIVYLSGHGTVSIGVEAMRHGAYDFLEKPVDEAALLSVVEAAIARRQQACSEENHLNDIRQRVTRLSPRERQVMDNVIRGRLNKQIACDLDIGVKTVKVHRSRVMSKMKVRSVAELVHLCDAIGLGQQNESDSV